MAGEARAPKGEETQTAPEVERAGPTDGDGGGGKGGKEVSVDEVNINLYNPGLLLKSMADPPIRDCILRVSVIVVVIRYGIPETELVQRGDWVAEFQQPVDKSLEQRRRLTVSRFRMRHLELLVIGVDAGHGAPEVAPPLGQHARLHCLARGEEGHDVVEDSFREVAEPVSTGGAPPGTWAARACQAILPWRPSTQRPFVEQVACVETAEMRDTKNQQAVDPELNRKQDLMS
ncbi:hypothetical protein OsJ_30593 [Oryza sativa Japonica Group]|uniref:Uncharacterized protein n=1 Tax=Oryza sativa subsp. japonica TaxID=39947 RepID=B9G7C1_ORYSJ|nr:hypothetical protein OsJ_30593 [Oryza sativa Japonica Group]